MAESSHNVAAHSHIVNGAQRTRRLAPQGRPFQSRSVMRRVTNLQHSLRQLGIQDTAPRGALENDSGTPRSVRERLHSRNGTVEHRASGRVERIVYNNGPKFPTARPPPHPFRHPSSHEASGAAILLHASKRIVNVTASSLVMDTRATRTIPTAATIAFLRAGTARLAIDTSGVLAKPGAAIATVSAAATRRLTVHTSTTLTERGAAVAIPRAGTILRHAILDAAVAPVAMESVQARRCGIADMSALARRRCAGIDRIAIACIATLAGIRIDTDIIRTALALPATIGTTDIAIRTTPVC